MDKGVVSKQDGDEKQADFDVRQAEVAAAQANITAGIKAGEASEAGLRRFEELKSFSKVTAPFDGIITSRNMDIGTLVNAGNGGPNAKFFASHRFSACAFSSMCRRPMRRSSGQVSRPNCVFRNYRVRCSRRSWRAPLARSTQTRAQCWPFSRRPIRRVFASGHVRAGEILLSRQQDRAPGPGRRTVAGPRRAPCRRGRSDHVVHMRSIHTCMITAPIWRSIPASPMAI